MEPTSHSTNHSPSSPKRGASWEGKRFEGIKITTMVPFLKYQTSIKGARQILLKGVYAVKGGITPKSAKEKTAKRSVKGRHQ